MQSKTRSFTALSIVIATAGICILPLRSHALPAKPPEQKFADLIELNYSGEVVSGTGVRDQGGFTVVTLQADKARTKVAVSLAVKEQGKWACSDFRVLAVDKAGKRHPAKDPNSAGAGGQGVTIITIVSEFDLRSDTIASLVIQRAASPTKPPATPPVDHVDLPEF